MVGFGSAMGHCIGKIITVFRFSHNAKSIVSSSETIFGKIKLEKFLNHYSTV